MTQNRGRKGYKRNIKKIGRKTAISAVLPDISTAETITIITLKKKKDKQSTEYFR